MKGRDLLTEPLVKWESRGSALLLNPRFPDARRAAVLHAEFPNLEDHVWLATSGTGGRTKLVALSRQALESSAQAVNAHLGATPRDIWLNPLPLFHVGGLGIVVRAALSGARWEPCGSWSAEAFMRQVAETRATLASLVPTQVHDLVKAGCPAPPSLRAVVVGGGVLAPSLLTSMRSRGWNLLPSYGLTEAASQVATAEADATDFDWLPLLSHIEARLGEDGVLELRGESLLDGWMVFSAEGQSIWEDPKHDGWYRTGDLAELRGRQVRVLGRADDLIKIRGELVDIAELERTLQARVLSGRVALEALPDKRAGHELHIVADTAETADEARALIEETFPAYARPRDVRVGTVPQTPLGKTMRATRA